MSVRYMRAALRIDPGKDSDKIVKLLVVQKRGHVNMERGG